MTTWGEIGRKRDGGPSFLFLHGNMGEGKGREGKRRVDMSRSMASMHGWMLNFAFGLMGGNFGSKGDLCEQRMSCCFVFVIYYTHSLVWRWCSSFGILRNMLHGKISSKEGCRVCHFAFKFLSGRWSASCRICSFGGKDIDIGSVLAKVKSRLKSETMAGMSWQIIVYFMICYLFHDESNDVMNHRYDLKNEGWETRNENETSQRRGMGGCRISIISATLTHPTN